MSQLVIWSLPEMMRQAAFHFPGQEDRVTNYCSGVFNSCLGVGQVAGPLFGSGLTTALGFRTTQDIVALITFSYGLLYFLFGGGCEAFASLSSKRRT